MLREKPFKQLLSHLQDKRQFIQAIIGPRQIGKTTLVKQVLKELGAASHYVSADEPGLQGDTWLEQQWQVARLLAEQQSEAVLVVDEIQKLKNWSATVKKCWDEDTANDVNVKVVLLGSTSLFIQEGLTESLAGRFETIHMRHWSFAEMQEAFDWSLDQYIYFGGYPGAAPLIDDEDRWRNYINDSLIETTISRDILLMNRVDKPILLRRLFQLACAYSSQILSYTKMLGQLLDAGNTTTLAHYLQLLTDIGALAGLEKYSGSTVRQRASSPKLQVQNTALMTAQQNKTFEQAKQDLDYWGRLVESTVGAHLINQAVGKNIELYYWRDKNKEVDFVLQQGEKLTGIEVKSGSKQTALPGMAEFKKQYDPDKVLLVGAQGLPLEIFLQTPIESL
tara:strand:+ start:17076 stop:18254 length:1179 start_codon:yes stop_codon:yes gene_type:complete